MALWNLNMLSIGRVADPASLQAMSISQLKRLELREGAEGLKDRERRDFAAAKELTPKLFPFTPNPGTQQDWLLQDILTEVPVSVEWWASLSSCGIEFPRLTGLLLSSASSAWVNKDFSSAEDKEAHAQSGWLTYSSLPVSTLAEQPIALEDKQTFLKRPLQAQPEKSLTSAESDAGAASDDTKS